MLAFHCKIIDSILKKLWRDISDNYVSTFIFYECFGSSRNMGEYKRHYILAFPLLWVVTSAYFDYLKKDK